MRKHALMLLTALLLLCLASGAGAEAANADMIERYLGSWVNDEYRLYIRLEGEEIYSRLTQSEGDYAWEFDRCWYDAEEDRLYGDTCVRYREYIDWDTMELVQDDWSLADMVFAYFAFGEDEDTLIACDIPHIDEPLTFRRVIDEEYFGF